MESVGVGRGWSRNYINTVLMYEVLKKIESV